MNNSGKVIMFIMKRITAMKTVCAVHISHVQHTVWYQTNIDETKNHR